MTEIPKETKPVPDAGELSDEEIDALPVRFSVATPERIHQTLRIGATAAAAKQRAFDAGEYVDRILDLHDELAAKDAEIERLENEPGYLEGRLAGVAAQEQHIAALVAAGNYLAFLLPMGEARETWDAALAGTEVTDDIKVVD